MAKLPSIVARGRAVPWATVLAVGMQVAREGKRRWDRLSKREQDELLRIVRKAPGGPSAFTAHDRAQLRRIVRKVAAFD
jgi:hypothetical protein